MSRLLGVSVLVGLVVAACGSSGSGSDTVADSSPALEQSDDCESWRDGVVLSDEEWRRGCVDADGVIHSASFADCVDGSRLWVAQPGWGYADGSFTAWDYESIPAALEGDSAVWHETDRCKGETKASGSET